VVAVSGKRTWDGDAAGHSSERKGIGDGTRAATTGSGWEVERNAARRRGERSMARSARGEIETVARGGTKHRAGCEINGWTRLPRGSTMEAGNWARQRDLVVERWARIVSEAAGGAGRRAGRPSVVHRGRGWSRLGGSI
jgi:hypothetical protein